MLSIDWKSFAFYGAVPVWIKFQYFLDLCEIAKFVGDNKNAPDILEFYAKLLELEAKIRQAHPEVRDIAIITFKFSNSNANGGDSNDENTFTDDNVDANSPQFFPAVLLHHYLRKRPINTFPRTRDDVENIIAIFDATVPLPSPSPNASQLCTRDLLHNAQVTTDQIAYLLTLSKDAKDFQQKLSLAVHLARHKRFMTLDGLFYFLFVKLQAEDRQKVFDLIKSQPNPYIISIIDELVHHMHAIEEKYPPVVFYFPISTVLAAARSHYAITSSSTVGAYIAKTQVKLLGYHSFEKALAITIEETLSNSFKNPPWKEIKEILKGSTTTNPFLVYVASLQPTGTDSPAYLTFDQVKTALTKLRDSKRTETLHVNQRLTDAIVQIWLIKGMKCSFNTHAIHDVYSEELWKNYTIDDMTFLQQCGFSAEALCWINFLNANQLNTPENVQQFFHLKLQRFIVEHFQMGYKAYLAGAKSSQEKFDFFVNHLFMYCVLRTQEAITYEGPDIVLRNDEKDILKISKQIKIFEAIQNAETRGHLLTTIVTMRFMDDSRGELPCNVDTLWENFWTAANLRYQKPEDLSSLINILSTKIQDYYEKNIESLRVMFNVSAGKFSQVRGNAHIIFLKDIVLLLQNGFDVLNILKTLSAPVYYRKISTVAQVLTFIQYCATGDEHKENVQMVDRISEKNIFALEKMSYAVSSIVIKMRMNATFAHAEDVVMANKVVECFKLIVRFIKNDEFNTDTDIMRFETWVTSTYYRYALFDVSYERDDSSAYDVLMPFKDNNALLVFMNNKMSELHLAVDNAQQLAEHQKRRLKIFLSNVYKTQLALKPNDTPEYRISFLEQLNNAYAQWWTAEFQAEMQRGNNRGRVAGLGRQGVHHKDLDKIRFPALAKTRSTYFKDRKYQRYDASTQQYVTVAAKTIDNELLKYFKAIEKYHNENNIESLFKQLIASRSNLLVMAFKNNYSIQLMIINSARKDPSIKSWFMRVVTDKYNAAKNNHSDSDFVEWYEESLERSLDDERHRPRSTLSVWSDEVAANRAQYIDNTTYPPAPMPPAGKTWEALFHEADGLEFCRLQGLLGDIPLRNLMDNKVSKYHDITCREMLRWAWLATYDIPNYIEQAIDTVDLVTFIAQKYPDFFKKYRQNNDPYFIKFMAHADKDNTSGYDAEFAVFIENIKSGADFEKFIEPLKIARAQEDIVIKLAENYDAYADCQGDISCLEGMFERILDVLEKFHVFYGVARTPVVKPSPVITASSSASASDSSSSSSSTASSSSSSSGIVLSQKDILKHLHQHTFNLARQKLFSIVRNETSKKPLITNYYAEPNESKWTVNTELWSMIQGDVKNEVLTRIQQETRSSPRDNTPVSEENNKVFAECLTIFAPEQKEEEKLYEYISLKLTPEEITEIKQKMSPATANATLLIQQNNTTTITTTLIVPAQQLATTRQCHSVAPANVATENTRRNIHKADA